MNRIPHHNMPVEGTLYKPVMCIDEPAPKAAIELIKCGCKRDVLARDVSATVTNCLAHLSVNAMPLSVQISSRRKYEYDDDE